MNTFPNLMESQHDMFMNLVRIVNHINTLEGWCWQKDRGRERKSITWQFGGHDCAVVMMLIVGNHRPFGNTKLLRVGICFIYNNYLKLFRSTVNYCMLVYMSIV